MERRWVPRCCVGGAARMPPTWRPRPGGRRAPAGPPAVLRRSAPRRPRAALDLLQQRLDDVQVHRQLADLALRVEELAVLDRRRPGLEALMPGVQEVLAPPDDRAAACPVSRANASSCSPRNNLRTTSCLR